MQNKKHFKIVGAAIAVMCSLTLLMSSAVTGFAAESTDAQTAAQEVQQTEETTAPAEEVTEPSTEAVTEEATEPTEEAAEEATEATEETEAATLPDKDDSEPLAASAPNVRLSNTPDGIKLSWSAVNNAKQYLVCGTEAGKNDWKKYTVDKTEHLYNYVESGKQYYFQVQAILNDGTKTSFSSPKALTFMATPHLNPVVNSFETDKSLRLSWSVVPGANCYRIAKMRIGAENYEYIDTETNSYVDTNVFDGNTYHYQVTAMYVTPKNGTAYSCWSSASSMKISFWPAITLQNVSNGVKVVWDAVKNTKQYFVYCKKPTDANWTRVVTKNLNYTFTGLTSGQLYYFQMYSDSISGKDGKFSATKNIVYLEPPKVSISSNTAANTISLSWNKANGAAKYQIARKPSDAKNYEYITVSGTSYTDKKVPAGKYCAYQVRAATASNVYGYWSKTVVGETCAKPEITMSNNASGVRAAWSKADNAASYTVYYKESTAGSWSSAETTNLYYQTNNLKSGKLYFFQLRYTGKGGVKSPFSDVKSITFTQQGSLLSLRTSGKAVYLRWSALSGADYYVIERTNINTGKKGTIAVGNVTEYTDKSAVYEQTSSYRVCGVHRETDTHKVYANAAGAYSGAIRINPRAYNSVSIGLNEQGQKGQKYCNALNNGRLDEWCAIFAGWALKQAGYILSECGYSANVGVWCDNLYAMDKFGLRSNYTPVMGDLIIFGRSDFRSHIGLVVGVSDGYVITIEGNAAVPDYYSGEWMANSYVIKKQYELDSYRIYGYGKMTLK